MKIYHKSVRAYLLLLLAMVFVLNAVVSWRLPVWHPRNELAHYDYIDKLADLQIPRPGDRISQYSYDITMDHFEWKQPDGFDGSIESMGIEGESYEAQQPPVYYLLLAGPNALLKKLGADPLDQIRLLRMCQLAIACIGFLMVIPVFIVWGRISGSDPWTGLLAASGMALVSVEAYGSLGNDSASLCVCTLATWMILRWWERDSRSRALFAGLAVGLAFFVKYTNGLLFGVHAAAWLLITLRDRKRMSFRHGASLAIPSVLVLIVLALNFAIYDDVLRTSATKESFEVLISPIPGVQNYLRTLILSAFTVSHLKWVLPFSLPLFIVAAIALNFLLSLYRSCCSRRTETDFVVLLSCLVAIAILAAGTLLNEVRPGVRWGGFRHFFGYQLFWYIAIFHPPFRLSPRWRELIQSVVIIGMSILAIRYAMVVFSLNP